MELVEHYLSMLIILEFNKVIADLQKQKKVQKQKNSHILGTRTPTTTLNVERCCTKSSPLSPQTETLSKTRPQPTTTPGDKGGTQLPREPPQNPTDSQGDQSWKTGAAGSQRSQGGSNQTQNRTSNLSGQNASTQGACAGVGATGAGRGAGGGDD